MTEKEDWLDHAVPCPNCQLPVKRDDEHVVKASLEDPGWWKCDRV